MLSAVHARRKYARFGLPRDAREAKWTRVAVRAGRQMADVPENEDDESTPENIGTATENVEVLASAPCDRSNAIEAPRAGIWTKTLTGTRVAPRQPVGTVGGATVRSSLQGTISWAKPSGSSVRQFEILICVVADPLRDMVPMRASSTSEEQQRSPLGVAPQSPGQGGAFAS